MFQMEAETWLMENDPLQFEAMLESLSARFINVPGDQVDRAIENAQRQICESLDIDVAALWHCPAGSSGSWILSHVHAPPDFPPIPMDFDAADVFPWCLEQVRRGKNVVLERLADAPPEAAPDLGSWRYFGLQSVLVFPLSVGGGPCFGALSFNTTRRELDWPADLIGRLQLVAQQFANALARKFTDQRLRDSETRYRTIFEGAIEGIYQTTPEGRPIVVNSALATMLGYDSPEEFIALIKDTASQVWTDPGKRMALVQLLETQETVRGHECQFLCRDGTRIWISLNARAVRGPDGNLAYYEGFVENISRRKSDELCLRRALEEVENLRNSLEQENIQLRDRIRDYEGTDDIVGESQAIIQMLDDARRVAPADSTVLITGETGTGKELLADVIHRFSRRAKHAMIKVNCAALPPSLIESELFGRERGAFTGAMTRQPGRFEAADGSTLFLDEIAELPLELQPKLLRVLQEGQFERLGSNLARKVNVRVIAATNHNLEALVKAGKFRDDLYYRLNIFPINVPPLRDRRDDIPLLVWNFLRYFTSKMGKSIDSVPKQVMTALTRHDWPGNIRELRNLIERSVILTDSKVLQVQFAEATSVPAGPLTFAEVERQHILAVLEKTHWRISGPRGAASVLGLVPTTLNSKMKKLQIHRPFAKHPGKI